MNEREYLLDTLQEECAEVIQPASKAMRFGLKSVNPYITNDPPNSEKIIIELCDILAVAEMLVERGYLRKVPYEEIRDRIDAKKERVLRTMEWSRDRGCLDS